MVAGSARSRTLRGSILSVFLLLCCSLIGALVVQGAELTPNLSKRTLLFPPSGERDNGISFAHADTPTEGAVTLVSTLRFGDDWSGNASEEIWLAGVTEQSGEASLGLGLVWTKEQVGWIQAWRIQLRDNLGVQPKRTGLETLNPQPGHTYTTLFSYDPGTGAGSLKIADESSGELVYVGAFETEVHPGSLYAATGVSSRNASTSGGSVRVAELAVYNEYLPVGSRLEVAAESKPSLAFGMFDRDEDIFLRLVAPGALPSGAFWVQAQHHDTGRTERIGPIRVTDNETRLPPLLLHLPGETTLALEYIVDGHSWLRSAIDVSIGWLNVGFGRTAVDREEGAVRTEIHIESDGDLERVPLTVAATLRVTARDPASKTFQTHEYPRVTLFDGQVSASKVLTKIPVDISLPESAPFGLWEVSYHIEEPETSLDVRRFEAEHLFMLTPPGRAAEAAQTLGADDGVQPIISLEEEAHLRREAANRQRRILFNNDGGDARAPRTSLTVERFLQTRTSALVGSQVDTIIYDTTSGTFGTFSHWTEVAEVAFTREGVYQYNFTPELILDHGTDPLHVMVDFAQENGIEIFWAMRMNDIHDAGNNLLMSDLKREHPEWLFGSADQRPPRAIWSGIDYGRPQVRELAFRTIEEVAANYDVDGIMMDFFRHPGLFKRAAWGEPLGQSELDALTDLIRRVRERTREIGAVRGRPILLAVRVPDSVAFNRAIGIDLERWLAEGLVDLFVPTGYFRLSHWHESIELGRRYGVPVYPSLDESRVSDTKALDPDRNSLQSYRARAANLWQAGASGIHLFNMFRPTHPMLHEIGSPQSLVGKEKVYYVSFRGNTGYGNPRRWVGDHAQFASIPVLTPDSPMRLPIGESLSLDLDVGEDVEAAVAAGFTPEITLRLVTSEDVHQEWLDVRLNDFLLERDSEFGSTEYTVDPAWLRRGINRVQVALSPGEQTEAQDAPRRLYDLQLYVRYHRGT